MLTYLISDAYPYSPSEGYVVITKQQLCLKTNYQVLQLKNTSKQPINLLQIRIKSPLGIMIAEAYGLSISIDPDQMEAYSFSSVLVPDVIINPDTIYHVILKFTQNTIIDKQVNNLTIEANWI
jgi:hypothetical protein